MRSASAPELLVAHRDLAVDLGGLALRLPVALADAGVDRGGVDDGLDLVELLPAEVQRAAPVAAGRRARTRRARRAPPRPCARRTSSGACAAAAGPAARVGVAPAMRRPICAFPAPRRSWLMIAACAPAPAPSRGAGWTSTVRLRTGGGGAFGRRPGNGSLSAELVRGTVAGPRVDFLGPAGALGPRRRQALRAAWRSPGGLLRRGRRVDAVRDERGDDARAQEADDDRERGRGRRRARRRPAGSSTRRTRAATAMVLSR